MEDIARALGAAAVAGVDAVAAHVYAVGVGHADAPTLLRQQMRNQAHRGGLAVGAGYGHHGNAPVVARLLNKLDDDGLAHLAALAE
jgi:hypothetical protein